MKKLTALFIIVGFILVLIIGCAQDKTEQTTTKTPAEPTPDSLVILIVASDSVSVFDLLETNHKIEFLSTASGVFVKTIDSVQNSDDAFWLYSVNGEIAKTAADKFTVGAGDTVRWHFKKLE